jgi:hypothetical protein
MKCQLWKRKCQVWKDKCLSGKHVYPGEFLRGLHDFTLVFSVETRVHVTQPLELTG